MSELFRLVYASKNLIQAAKDDMPAAVAQILEVSQRNNNRAGVSGALMFNGSAFAQVLEGPRTAVEATFERIQRDDRHGEVTVLQCSPVDSRGFENWSMAFVGRSARGLSLWSELAAASGFDVKRLDGDAVFTMLHDLVLEEEGLSETDARGLPHIVPAAGRVQAPPHSGLQAGKAEPQGAQPTAAPRAAHSGAPPAGRRSGEVEAAPPQRGEASGVDAILAVVQTALTEHYRQAAELRADADALREALSVERERCESLRRDRNLWAGRAELLASGLCREASEAVQASLARSVTGPGRGAEVDLRSAA